MRFRHEATNWRCVEYLDLLMLPGERYRVGDREFVTLGEALRHLMSQGDRPAGGNWIG